MSGDTLAGRLAKAVGVDLSRGDTEIVEAVERVVVERDALAAARAKLEEQCGTFAALATRATAAGERLQAENDRMRKSYAGSPAADGRAIQAALDALGVPLSDCGPVVRAVYLAGLQGYTARGGE